MRSRWLPNGCFLYSPTKHVDFWIPAREVPKFLVFIFVYLRCKQINLANFPLWKLNFSLPFGRKEIIRNDVLMPITRRWKRDWVRKKGYVRKAVCWLESVVGKWVNEEVKHVFTGFILKNSVQPVYKGRVEKITLSSFLHYIC